jgi:hypothetical protein
MPDLTMKYSINLNFGEVKLPPFQEIFILGRNTPQGRIALTKSLELLAPDAFQMIEVNEEDIEAVFIQKKVLRKLPADKIIKILREKVFPYVTDTELVRVDFKVNISYNNLEFELGEI